MVIRRFHILRRYPEDTDARLETGPAPSNLGAKYEGNDRSKRAQDEFLLMASPQATLVDATQSKSESSRGASKINMPSIIGQTGLLLPFFVPPRSLVSLDSRSLECRAPVLTDSKVSAVELKLEEMANEAERHARRSSFSHSIQEAKRKAERETLPASMSAAGGRRRSRMKRRGRWDRSSRCLGIHCTVHTCMSCHT